MRFRAQCAAVCHLLVLLCGVWFGTACKPSGAPAGGGAGGPPGKGPGGPGGFTVQVVAVDVRKKPVIESISLVGSVTPNEMVEIKTEIDGTIEEIAFKEGEKVTQGQLLVRLDESKLRASVTEAEANHRLAEANFNRSKQLYADKLVPQSDFDRDSATFAVSEASLELRRRQLKDTRVYAAFPGTVGARLVSPGQVVSRNTTLTWLVDLETVKVEVSVPERYLGQVSLGQKLKFKVAAFPNQTFEGDVFFVAPQLDVSTRTALVKARVPNPDGKLKGGMFASLDLNLTLRESALVIPEPALLHNVDKVMVFVVNAEQQAMMRPVEVGLRLAGRAEILKGLTEGEKVVVEGHQKLAPGMKVKLAPKESSAPYESP